MGPMRQDLSLFVVCVRAYAALALNDVVDPDRAIPLLDEARDLSVSAEHFREAIDIAMSTASLQRRAGQLANSIGTQEYALSLVERHGDMPQRATILTNLASALRDAGELQ